MTETNERITVLETNMKNVLEVLSKREDYQTSVLLKLNTIENKQDQFLTYQTHCDGERQAHATRIGALENKTARTSTTWDTLLKLGSALGTLVALVLSALALRGHP